jgi:hypothetical protein
MNWIFDRAKVNICRALGERVYQVFALEAILLTELEREVGLTSCLRL